MGPSDKTIGRLSLYRRLLAAMRDDGASSVYSHQLATLARGTAAQVRRDVMSTGYSGSPTRGYDINQLLDHIGEVLDGREPEGIALAGVGNLGRAILAYFAGRAPNLSITAAFDTDPDKINRVIHGCRVYEMHDLPAVVEREGIKVGIIAVPAEAAQRTASVLISAGVRGLLNFAPVRLWSPDGVYVEDMDVAMAVERVAYFARRGVAEKESVK